RKIPVPQKGVRPTSERVREAVMSILGNDWSGRRVLDCFAGSGAMGFEALSRGAQHVHFVDSSAAVCRHLSKVSELLKVETLVKVQKANAAEALNSLAARGQHFDILFFDPPYGQQLLDTVLEHAQNLITSTSVVVAEHEPEYAIADTFGCLQRTQTRGYGSSVISLFETVHNTETSQCR
ncbi:MAG TPA: 16S rRNA (guanine(966)-N(2))-methyltransferase RsmD, partial [Myxococcales bacterium]|nr:16S rRNA (guanine(966)-N(2))-methyltransferase RsmD [Myxococcales bacterium]